LAITVLDTDTGVGIIRRRESQLRSRWISPVELDNGLQDALLALVESGKYKEAFYFFRSHGASLVDLRPNCTKISILNRLEFGGRKLLSPIRAQVTQVLDALQRQLG
jgi:hypothetical protein